MSELCRCFATNDDVNFELYPRKIGLRKIFLLLELSFLLALQPSYRTQNQGLESLCDHQHQQLHHITSLKSDEPKIKRDFQRCRIRRVYRHSYIVQNRHNVVVKFIFSIVCYSCCVVGHDNIRNGCSDVLFDETE